MREFGIVPTVAWHADAFGHSSTTARLFADMGYEGFFFGRISDAYKEFLVKNKDMHFMWKPTFEGEGGAYQHSDGIYTHALYKSYIGPCEIGFGQSDNH
jgi:lysosomal alpha-mannosidase